MDLTRTCRPWTILSLGILFFELQCVLMGVANKTTVVFVSRNVTWLEAHTICTKNYSGYLADRTVFETKANIPECANSEYWIADIEVVTPFISLKGCFNYISSSFPEETPTETSVEQCAVICSNKDFLIQEQQCICLEDDYEFDRNQINASFCNHRCRDDSQFCGGTNAANKYSFFLLAEASEVDYKECLFDSCDTGARYAKGRCYCDAGNCLEDLNLTHLLCNVTSVEENFETQEGKVDDWLKAIQKCIIQSDRYPIVSFTPEICERISGKSKPSTWTSTTTYQGNATSYKADDEFVEKGCAISDPISTVVAHTESTPSRTTEQREYISTFSSIQTTTDMINSQHFTNNKGGKSALGPVIGGVVGGALVILAMILTTIFIKRRRKVPAGKDKSYENSEANITNSQSTAVLTDNVYFDMKEGEYDQLNTKRKTISADPQIYDVSTQNHYGKIDRERKANSGKGGQTGTEPSDNPYSHIKANTSPMAQGNEYDYSSHSKISCPKNDVILYDSCS